MPAIASYPIDKPKILEEVAATEAKQRMTAIDRNWAYYRGEHRKQLKVRQGQADDNVIINMARRIVNQSVFLLFGQAPKIVLPKAKEDSEGSSDKPAPKSPAQKALDTLWEKNQAPTFLYNLGTSGALVGHNFVKMLPSPEHPAGVRLVRQDQRILSVFWLPDDRDHVVCYKIQWTEGEEKYRQDIVNMEQYWLVRDLLWTRNNEWQVTQETAWPYPFAPLVDWQNQPDPENYYGRPDLLNPGLNDNLNFVASNVNRILKHHAHPKTIGTGVTANQVQQTAVDGFWAVPSDKAQIFNLEMASDLSSSMAFAEFLQASFYSEHSAVDIASLKDRLGQLTNFGLRSLFWDALNKLAVKQVLYGMGLAQLSQRSLILLGHADVPEPEIQWGDPLPFNKLEQVEELEKELDLDLVSKETAAGELGRDWKTESDRIEKERQENPGAEMLADFDRQPGQPSRAKLMGLRDE